MVPMAQPFIGEIKMVGFGFAPRGYALCNGQILPIAQNQALFSILGTTYGGNGQTTFALPNLQGRTPLHVGPGFILGQVAGEQAHTLTIGEIPSHSHSAQGAPSAGAADAAGNVWGGLASGTVLPYSNAAPNVSLVASAIANSGGSQPHDNMQPYLVINFIIALQGVFPSRN
jgi:microcystin-dependent protein